MIDKRQVINWLDGVEPSGYSVPTATPQAKRDHEETLMFLEELRLRYPKEKPSEELAIGAVTAANKLSVITAAGISRVVTAEEARLGLRSTAPDTTTGPGTGVPWFLALLAQRRGAYHWVGGTTQAFTGWLNGAAPLHTPLPLDARLNCWEPLIAAAAEAGLLQLTDLRAAYAGQGDSRTGAVEGLLTNGRTVHTIQHPATPATNGIAAGDVIMISGADGPMHHVVAAVAEDRNDYAKVGVMSLWRAVGGGGFTRTLLGSVLTGSCTIRHLALTG